MPSRQSRTLSSTTDSSVTVPGVDLDAGLAVGHALQLRLHALNDLALTLKHVHWNVVGPHFIGVHTMLDPQIEGVRAMIDETAERMAMLGVSPNGLPGALVAARSWDDYSLARADVSAHLGAVDSVYRGVIADHRQVMNEVEDADPVTQDMLIGQIAELEKYHWFVRAHLEDAAGTPSTTGTGSERSAARKAVAAEAAPRKRAARGRSAR